MMRQIFRSALRAVAIVFVARMLVGCGGATQAVPAGVAGVAGTTVVVRVDLPLTGAASSRRPAYVSTATQSLVVTILTTGGKQVGSSYVNLTSASPGCSTVTTSGGSTLACTVTIALAITASGTYSLSTATYDQAQTQGCTVGGAPACSGNLLSSATLAATLTANGTNTVSLALGGIPASITATPTLSGLFQGSAAGLKLWGPTSQTLTLAALDAQGYTIVGTGAPTLALSSGSANAQVATSSAGVFTVQATTSGTPAIVTPGTVTLTATATPNAQSGGSTLTTSIPLAIAHSVVFVSSTSGGQSVVAFFDGNTTSSLTLATTTGGANPRGIATDKSGNVYVADHGNGNLTVCTAASAYSSCSTPITGLSCPEGVAVDGSGNVWIAASCSNNVVEYTAGSYGAPSFTLSTGLGLERAVIFDSNGNLWVANQGGPAEIVGYAPPYTGAPYATVTTGIDQPIQINGDASGDVWVADCGLGCGGSFASIAQKFAPPIASGSGPSGNLSTGINVTQGISVDGAGNVWIADSGNGAVLQCPPPVGTAACTSFSVPGALWLQAFPPAVNHP